MSLCVCVCLCVVLICCQLYPVPFGSSGSTLVSGLAWLSTIHCCLSFFLSPPPPSPTLSLCPSHSHEHARLHCNLRLRFSPSQLEYTHAHTPTAEDDGDDTDLMAVPRSKPDRLEHLLKITNYTKKGESGLVNFEKNLILKTFKILIDRAEANLPWLQARLSQWLLLGGGVCRHLHQVLPSGR